MHDLLMEVLKSLVVVTAFIWVPCGILGAVMTVRYLVWEWKYRRSLNRVYEQEDEEEYGEEVVYR